MDNRSVQQRNRELAKQINDEARANPQSPYAGKFVGLANGQVVIVADSLDEAAERLRQVEPDPQRCFLSEAGFDYETPQYIWGMVGDAVRSLAASARSTNNSSDIPGHATSGHSQSVGGHWCGDAGQFGLEV